MADAKLTPIPDARDMRVLFSRDYDPEEKEKWEEDIAKAVEQVKNVSKRGTSVKNSPARTMIICETDRQLNYMTWRFERSGYSVKKLSEPALMSGYAFELTW